MFAYGIFKVIYSPYKAFKEVAQNPRFIGPFLIMLLFVIASVGRDYARASNTYVQQTLPSALDPYNPDPWTENCTMWVSNANINYSHDSILGDKSIQFTIINDTKIWAELSNIGKINCIDAEGYKNLTLRIKWIHPTAQSPKNFSLYLFSTNLTEYFYCNLTEHISETKNGTWNNFTIPLGPSAEQWLGNNVQAWSNITGLKIELMWAESARSNLTVLLDRLFFQSENFETVLNFMGGNIVISVLSAIMGYSLYWMLFAVATFIVARILHIKTELRIFLVIIGYALIALFIMNVLSIIFYLSIPPLYFSIDSMVPISVLQSALLFSFYISLILPIWSIVLSFIGIHVTFSLPLSKSAAIAVIGFSPYYILFFLA